MNKITLQPTIFENFPQGSKTYGYRMYDDYDQSYNNTWESISNNDLEILALVIDDEDHSVCAMIDYVLEHQTGIYISDTWYEWDKIKHLFQEG